MILSIESGTEVCSVCIVREGEVLSLRESVEGRDHARLVACFADEVLRECGVTTRELSAVAVSEGPGSYTGLRIGVSFAKGLCYGAQIPLIGVSSLEALVESARAKQREGLLGVEAAQWSEARLAPMVDARRMEVYTQLFNSEGVAQSEVEARVIDENSFAEGGRNLILFGDGARKCAEVLPHATFVDVAPSAVGVARIAERKLERGEVEDVAYFEPFYLKDVVITTSKRRYFYSFTSENRL